MTCWIAYFQEKRRPTRTITAQISSADYTTAVKWLGARPALRNHNEGLRAIRTSSQGFGPPLFEFPGRLTTAFFLPGRLARSRKRLTFKPRSPLGIRANAPARKFPTPKSRGLTKQLSSRQKTNFGPRVGFLRGDLSGRGKNQ